MEPTLISVPLGSRCGGMRCEAGQVAVNLPTAGWDVHHPFGGVRESGSAFKEQGAPGLRFYTRIKTAAVRFAW